MIGAAGCVAKIAEFIITKLVGLSIELVLDPRRRAAMAFLSFYESLRCLELSSQKLEGELESVVTGKAARLFGVPMEQIAKELQDGTNAFIQSIQQLESVISIYDKELSAMLFGIRTMKQRTLGLLDLPQMIEMKLVWGRADCVFALETYTAVEGSGFDFQRALDQIYERVSESIRMAEDVFRGRGSNIETLGQVT